MRIINFSKLFLFSAAVVAFGETTPTAWQDPAKTLQIHLAFGGTASDPGMIVTWQMGHVEGTDLKEGQTPRVWYGASADKLDKFVDVKAEDSCTYFMSGQHVSAEITGLKHHTEYYYQVGAVDADNADVMKRSDVKHFTTARSHEQDSGFAISVFGDLGYGGINDEGYAATTKSRLDELRSEVDFYIHAGDLGYADNSFLAPSNAGRTDITYEERYNDWMNDLSTVTETKPYMPSVGNHEIENHSKACLQNDECKFGLGNFTAYNCRFKAPAKQSKGVAAMWYSFDYGSIHFVVTNTETDHPDAPEGEHGSLGNIPSGHFGADGEYLKWLKNDLEEADKNRAERPWIVTIGHRPLYVMHGEESYCKGSGENSPQGNCVAHEGLINKYADLHVTGHIHYSSRLLPTNPFGEFRTALVVPGGAGNDESPHREFLEDDKGSNDRFTYFNYGTGYSTGIIRAIDRFHLSYTLIDSETGKEVDHFTIAKNHCNPSGANSFKDIRTSLDKDHSEL